MHLEKPITNMTPEDFVKKLQDAKLNEATIIDVREPYEWEYYHLEEAILLPMAAIPERWEQLPREKPLYVVCAHGVRSEMVCRYLQQNGLRNPVNVLGGMAAVAALQGFDYD